MPDTFLFYPTHSLEELNCSMCTPNSQYSTTISLQARSVLQETHH